MTVVAAGMVVAGGASAFAATAAPATAKCSASVRITSLSFAPASVAPGASSAATLKVHNCTGKAQQTTTYWFGRFAGTGTGIPAGCPVLDPLPRSLAIPAHRTGTLTTNYRVFPTCTATSLQLTVRVVGADGTQLASRTAVLAIRS